ncbi:MAG: hypothetical protein U1F37_18270 [Alphaproteobacteria bacterium]
MAAKKKHHAPPVAHPMSAYRRSGEDILIELSLNKIGQLYNSFDPSPFHEKELDSDADAYIFSAVREIGADKPIKLVIDLPPEELKSPGAADVEHAIRNHFAYRLQTARRDLRHELQRGRTSLFIGLAFLAACMAGREVALTAVPSALQRILSEGLLIIGWVAMWGPLEVFLYGWWPIVGRRRILERLAVVDVDLVARANGREASGLGAAAARG